MFLRGKIVHGITTTVKNSSREEEGINALCVAKSLGRGIDLREEIDL